MKHILEVENLKKYYEDKSGFFSSKKEILKAVDDISFHINSGEVLGVVGESGCGKTTTGKCVLRLIEPTAGKIHFNGQEITHCSPEEMRLMRNQMQIVFQDAMSALDPRWCIEKSLAEPIRNFNNQISRAELREKTGELLELVGLTRAAGQKFPHEFSGGQRQRIGIAKAMSVNPRLIICDEPVSALDVSIQAQILNLFIKLKEEFNLSYMFISHDLSVVKYISDRVLVMYAGRIVEIADVKEFFAHPTHPYSRILIDAVPEPDPRGKQERQKIVTVQNVDEGHQGCSFYERCPRAGEKCRVEVPELKEVGSGHLAACFMV